jgi:ATP-binding cassette, subfamily B, bacterial PglK
MTHKYQLSFLYYIVKNFKIHTLSILLLSLFQAFLEVFSIFALIAFFLNVFETNNVFFKNIWFQELIEYSNISSLKITDIFLILVAIYLVKNIFLILIYWLRTTLCGQIYKDLSIKTYKTILERKISFFNNFSSGDFMQSVVYESEFAKEVLLSYINIFTEIIIIVFIFLILFFQDTFVSMSIILSIIIASIIYVVMLKKINNTLGKERQENSISIYNIIMQSLSFIKLIKLKNKENFFISNLESKVNKIYKINRNQSTIHYSAHIWLESCVLIGLFFSTLSLFDTIDYKSINISEAFIIVIISLRFIPSFSTIVGSLTNIQYGKVAVEKIMSFLKNFNSAKSFKRYELKVKKIELSSVFYRYENTNDFIINNYSLRVNTPSLIGIKGKNGSGKTTLLNIIAGLIKPEKGSVTVDGQNIHENDEILFNWKRIIGYVDQNKKFSNQTISETIAFGEYIKNFDQNKINECLEKVDLLNNTNISSDKINTSIGENGTKLSGGQMQRLNIARSLYDDPKIFVFDEITNNLDQNSKILIMNLILNLKKDKIIFISTHSDFILKHCDQIIEL